MQHSLSPVARRAFGNLPVRTAREADLAALVAQAVPEAKAGPDGLECGGPACIEAARLIPELDPIQGAATDAELDALLDDVLIHLEREGTSFFAPKPS